MLDLEPPAQPESLRVLGNPPLLDGGRTRRGRRDEYRRPLPPGQSESLASHVLGTGASGLSYVLGTLDEPGQTVRGILAGKGLSSLRNLVPFSDTIGLTTKSDRTTGRDLTDKLGLTNRGRQGLG